MEKRNRIFYGWWIVAGCFSLSFASVGIAMNSISILFRPVSEALGFSRGDFTLSFTVGAVAIMLSAPFIGTLYERRDARRVVLVSKFLPGQNVVEHITNLQAPMFPVGVMDMRHETGRACPRAVPAV